MKRAIDAWLQQAAEGGDDEACLEAAVRSANDVWEATALAQRFVAARVRVASEPVGLTAGLNIRALSGAGVIVRVPAGRRFPEAGGSAGLDRDTAMRWVDAGRSVRRAAPERVLILGESGAALAVAARAWGVPGIAVATTDERERRLLRLLVPEAEVLDGPTGRWPCVLARGADWRAVAAHALPGAGVGLRVGQEDLSPELDAWLADQSVRGRTGPEETTSGPYWLFGLVTGVADPMSSR
jgi:hypothetical protein